MTGMELHGELERAAPGQAGSIVFFTGGVLSPSARDFLDSVPNPRVVKPVNATVLKALVNSRVF
jgi:hypothetical protein